MDIARITRDGRTPPLPRYQTEAAAAMDIAAFVDKPVIIAPGGRAIIPTGLRIAVPVGWAALVLIRSSMGAKWGIRLSNGVGLIDPDYRGELQIALHNTSHEPFTVRDGDRLAQLLLTPAPQFAMRECAHLGDTARGAGGFGSTGVGVDEG